MSTNAVGAPLEAKGVHAQHPPQPSHLYDNHHDSSSDDKHDTDPEHDPDHKQNPAPPFLHSPPDSNNAHKSDASDSELSDLEDEPMLDGTSLPTLPSLEQDAPQDAPTEAQEEPEDIGEVLPDHWSGAVPIFTPTMHQFKDFQRFVRSTPPTVRLEDC